MIENPPRRAVDPDSERVAITRSRLLEAAEQLFLEQDPAGVSVRMINAAAGLNPGAVHYHFGSKDGLVLALLEERLTAHLRVFDRVDALAKASTVDLRAVVALAIEPMLQLARGNPHERLWARLLVDVIRRDPDSTFAREVFAPDRWSALAARALPELPAQVVRRRWSYAVSLLLAVVEQPRIDRDQLVAFIVGGLSA
jgi:AcrR family transcriptional regulator